MEVHEISGYIASFAIGISLGLLGGGGSILTVPVLVYFFKIEPLLSATYSLFVVGISSLVGSLRYYQQKNISIPLFLRFGLPSVFAVFMMRKYVMAALPQHIITVGSISITKSILVLGVFSVVMILAALSMLQKQSNALNNSPVKISVYRIILQAVFTGILTGFIGVGGGFLIIPALIYTAGLPMKKAVGTSLLIMALSALMGVMADLSRDVLIYYPFLILFTGFSIAGIFAGTYLSERINNQKLKPAFGWFVLIVGIFVLTNMITHF